MSKKDNSEEMKKEEVSQEEVENQETEAAVDKNTEDQEVSSEAEVKEEKSEVEVLNEKYNEVNDKFLRLYSEFDNYRKRTNKEKLDLYKTAGEDIFAALLPIMDDFERALKSLAETQDVKSVKKGVELIQQKFEKTLTQKGLKPIESAIGKEFDLDFHEAITRIPAPEKKLKGKVIDEVERGYMLNDKVIRYTKVVIGE